MNELSVVINTLNEEENIERAIKSVKKIADEIVVVDMESDDKTRSIARQLGAKVYMHRRMGYVEPARNFAISKAKGDWILILDADEEISPSLSKKIKRVINTTDKTYFTLPRKNIIFGRWIEHSGWWPDYNIRLFIKRSVTWDDEIHSVPVTTGKGGDFEPKEQNAIIHHNYKNIEQYINRLNRYTSIQAKEKWEVHKKFEWKNLLTSSTSEFVTRYFKHQGYKDGIHGLALSLLQSFSELVVEVKVWQEARFVEKEVSVKEVISEIRKSEQEVNYWNANTLFNQTGSIIEKFKRKFKLQ